MFSTRIRALVHRQWAGLIALFLVLTGGSAYALDGSNTVFTDDIVNGEVKIADVGQAAVGADELAANAVRAREIATDAVNAAETATGAVRTAEIQNGQVQAEDLAPGVAPGASGARAWGLVRADGFVLRRKNLTEVTHPDGGVYCIDPGSGIDPRTAVMLVGEGFASNSTSASGNDISHVEWSVGNLVCPAETMEVRTFIGFGSAPSESEIDFGGFVLLEGDQPFTFVIP